MFGKCQCESHRGENYEQKLEGHHRAERSQYPEYKNDPENIIWVCPTCHRNLIHSNGNMKILSAYGKGLKYEYLESVGEVKSITRDPPRRIENDEFVYHASGQNVKMTPVHGREEEDLDIFERYKNDKAFLKPEESKKDVPYIFIAVVFLFGLLLTYLLSSTEGIVRTILVSGTILFGIYLCIISYK